MFMILYSVKDVISSFYLFANHQQTCWIPLQIAPLFPLLCQACRLSQGSGLFSWYTFLFTLNDFPLHGAHCHEDSRASGRFQRSLRPVTQAVQFTPDLVLGVQGLCPLKRSDLNAVRPSSYCETSASPCPPGHGQMVLYCPVAIGHIYSSFSSQPQSLGPAHAPM